MIVHVCFVVEKKTKNSNLSRAPGQELSVKFGSSPRDLQPWIVSIHPVPLYLVPLFSCSNVPTHVVHVCCNCCWD